MIKEEYIEMRKLYPSFPLELFFNYWVDVKPAEYEELNFEQFSIYFREFLQIPVVAMSIHRIADRIIKYYDEKFGVIKIITNEH